MLMGCDCRRMMINSINQLSQLYLGFSSLAVEEFLMPTSHSLSIRGSSTTKLLKLWEIGGNAAVLAQHFLSDIPWKYRNFQLLDASLSTAYSSLRGRMSLLL